jgi:hypothetical protein
VTTVEDASVPYGTVFSSEVEAADIDIGDEITYGISTYPDIEIQIDPKTGQISWESNIDGLRRTERNTYLVSVTVTASDGEYTITQGFDIEVIPETPPDSKLVYPLDGMAVKYSDIYLEWKALYTEMEGVLFDLYLSPDWYQVSEHHSDAILLELTSDTRYEPEDLIKGQTYYWTVIPYGKCGCGNCRDLFFSFNVNTPPILSGPEASEVSAGDTLFLELDIIDPDEWDRNSISLDIVSGPEGLVVLNGTTSLYWKPGEDDVGTYIVVVQATDGKDDDEISLNISVGPAKNSIIPAKENGKEKKDYTLIFVLGIGGGTLMIIGIVIVLLLVLARKKKRRIAESEEQVPIVKNVDDVIDRELARYQESQQYKKDTGAPVVADQGTASDVNDVGRI